MAAGDPNGMSYEAWIESKAGASPVVGEDGLTYIEGVADQGLPKYEEWLRGYLRERGDWPQPKPPPYKADDENQTTPTERTP